MSSNNNEKPQISFIPESENLNTDVHASGQCFPSSFLVVGTEVSAKYRGAFCEATVDYVDLRFRLHVQLKSTKVVHKLGGFHRVSSHLKWGYVYSKMDIPQNFSASPRNPAGCLQEVRRRHLYHLKRIIHSEHVNHTEVDRIHLYVKQEVSGSITIRSVPDLSPGIHDDKQTNAVMMNKCPGDGVIFQPINTCDKQEKKVGKTVEDNDTEDDRCSVQTMSTDPRNGLLYDLTMSSEKSHLQLSSKENDDLEYIDNPLDLPIHHTDMVEEIRALSGTDDHPVSEIAYDRVVDETIVNETYVEPVSEQQEEEIKISEVEQTNLVKSRKRIRLSSNTSNSTDTSSKRGNKRAYLTPHRSTAAS
ncbi:unnamed protein product [Heterobilharzia americana]|nr:unnamed protein product [Heterobilharzia americana]